MCVGIANGRKKGRAIERDFVFIANLENGILYSEGASDCMTRDPVANPSIIPMSLTR